MKNDNCIFCKIANGEISSATVYEDGNFRVILDMGPASKGHALLIPKEHFKDLCELDDSVAEKVLPVCRKVGEAMKKSLGCAGFNLVQNNRGWTDRIPFPCTHYSTLCRRTENCFMDTWQRNTGGAGGNSRQNPGCFVTPFVSPRSYYAAE